MSKGQPNVNLLTFVSAKHKPTPKPFSCAMYVILQKRFSFHSSDTDGSLLCYLAWTVRCLLVDKKGMQHSYFCISLSFQATELHYNRNGIAATYQLGRHENFGQVCSPCQYSIDKQRSMGGVANGSKRLLIMNNSHRWCLCDVLWAHLQK